MARMSKSFVKTENHKITDAEAVLLKKTVGKRFAAYCSDMEMAGRAFENVVLRLEDGDLEMRIAGVESAVEWMRESTMIRVAPTSLETAAAPAGKVDADGTFVPNAFMSYPVGRRVCGVSVINERTVKTAANVVASEELVTSRGVVFALDRGYIAFDKVESLGEVWTIETSFDGSYRPPCQTKSEEAPEFTTTVEVVQL